MAKLNVTVLSGPCNVYAIKSKEKDGYEAVQLGFGEKKREENKQTSTRLL